MHEQQLEKQQTENGRDEASIVSQLLMSSVELQSLEHNERHHQHLLLLLSVVLLAREKADVELFQMTRIKEQLLYNVINEVEDLPSRLVNGFRNRLHNYLNSNDQEIHCFLKHIHEEFETELPLQMLSVRSFRPYRMQVAESRNSSYPVASDEQTNGLRTEMTGHVDEAPENRSSQLSDDQVESAVAQIACIRLEEPGESRCASQSSYLSNREVSQVVGASVRATSDNGQSPNDQLVMETEQNVTVVMTERGEQCTSEVREVGTNTVSIEDSHKINEVDDTESDMTLELTHLRVILEAELDTHKWKLSREVKLVRSALHLAEEINRVIHELLRIETLLVELDGRLRELSELLFPELNSSPTPQPVAEVPKPKDKDNIIMKFLRRLFGKNDST